MADREARARLTLNASSFQKGIKDASRGVAAEARSMGQAMSSGLSAGAKGGLDSIKSMFSSIKSVAMGLGAVVGGIGLAGLVKGAIDLQTKFRQLGFTLHSVGKMSSLPEVTADLKKLALETGQTTSELTDNFKELVRTTGDLDFAREAFPAIAKTATVTGQSVASLTGIVDGMNSAFGITGDEVPDMLAHIAELTSKSDVSAEELAGKFEQIGDAAKHAGITGAAGMQQTLALLIQAQSATGSMRKAISGLTPLLDELGTKTGRAGAFAKLGIADQGGNALDAMKQVIKATGGKKEQIAKAFGGTQANILVELGKDYASTFKATKGSVQEKTKAALAAFDAALAKAGESQTKAADINTMAAHPMANDPALQIQQGIEKLQQAFTQPEIIASMQSLAKSLPPLAEGMAKLLDMVVSNPGLAAGVLMGGNAALGGIGAALKEAFATGGPAAGKAVGDGLTSAAETAGGVFGRVAGGLLAGVAVLAISAALDQGVKLIKDLATRAQDDTDERENAMRNAEAQGKSTASRRVTGRGLDLTADDIEKGIGSEHNEILERGPDGKVRVKGKQSLKQGEMGPEGTSYGTGADAMSDAQRKAILGQVEEERSRSSDVDIQNTQDRKRSADPSIKRMMDAATSGGAKPLSAADIGAAFKSGFPKELNVRVTNAGELRGQGSGATGGPQPGHLPR